MLVTNERPTARQVTTRAWQSLFSAMRQMAPFFLTAFLLVLSRQTKVNSLQFIC